MSITHYNDFGNSKNVEFSTTISKVYDEIRKNWHESIIAWIREKDDEILIERDKDRYRNKGFRQTTIKTKHGPVSFKRRMYYDNNNKKTVYLLDEKLFSNAVGLVDEELCNIIANMITSMTYRKVSEVLGITLGIHISHQQIWNIVQELGQRERANIEELAELNSKNQLTGEVETKILYEEADGDWLKLQGNDRKQYGPSKEMKIAIAYDGATYQRCKGGKVRRTLDNKVAYSSFETVNEFRRHKEAVIASKYNNDEIELIVKNGDGAQWIQKDKNSNCICVLDEFHRNKKITECVSDKNIAGTLNSLLFSGQYQLLLEVIEAYINSIEDDVQVEKLKELYSYYSENFDALPGYYDRGIKIPETREPGVIHHARLGSMESNVFTLIGNRMKGGRACWSIEGGNNLAALLCIYHTSKRQIPKTDTELCKAETPSLSASKIKPTSGKGYEGIKNYNIPSTLPWLKRLASTN